MTKFMVLYMANPADFEKMMKDSTPEQQQKGMDAWRNWMTKHQASFVDGGAPLGKTKRVDASGTSDTRNGIGGYTIVQAEFGGRGREDVRNRPSASADARGLDRNRRDPADTGDVGGLAVCRSEGRLLVSAGHASIRLPRSLRAAGRFASIQALEVRLRPGRQRALARDARARARAGACPSRRPAARRSAERGRN